MQLVFFCAMNASMLLWASIQYNVVALSYAKRLPVSFKQIVN